MNKSNNLNITETPRDAMQGWKHPIPAAVKARYINTLLKVGFDTVDCGSFVSPKAIPQMADTAEVIALLDKSGSTTKLMALAGNARGGLQAASESKLDLIGFPYSVSATFLKKNLNTTPEAAWQTILELKDICERSQKELRVYLAMAFGNPYRDEWNDEIVIREAEKLYTEGIRDLVFSDITGEGSPGSIERLSSELVNSFPSARIGIHLHTSSNDWREKLEASWNAGIRNFEGAIGGFGGCPMSGYELLANLDTENLLNWCGEKGIVTGLDRAVFSKAKAMTTTIFR